MDANLGIAAASDLASLMLAVGAALVVWLVFVAYGLVEMASITRRAREEAFAGFGESLAAFGKNRAVADDFLFKRLAGDHGTREAAEPSGQDYLSSDAMLMQEFGALKRNEEAGRSSSSSTER